MATAIGWLHEQRAGTDFTEHLYAGARHEVFNETNQDEVLEEVCTFIDRVMR